MFIKKLLNLLREPFVRGSVIALIVLCVALFITQATSGEAFNFFSFLRDLEAELITAVLLGLFVDSFVKARLAKEIAQDVWPYASGHGLPDPVKKQFEELLRMPFIREDFRLVITLGDVPEKIGLVRAKLEVSYYVRNFLDTRVDYASRSKIEKSHYPDVGLSRIDYVHVHDYEGFPLAGRELADRIKDRGSYLEMPFEVTLPRASKGRLHIETERSRVYGETDTHVLDILETTLGITVVAQGPADIEWHVQFGGEFKPQERSQGNVHEWSDPARLYMPNHVISIHWKRKGRSATRPGPPVKASLAEIASGAAPFSGTPRVEDAEWHRASAWLEGEHFSETVGVIGVVGVPLHLGSITPARSDLAPQAIREGMRRFSSYDIASAQDLRQLHAFDAGDMAIADCTPEQSLSAIRNKVSELTATSEVAIVLGGDNSVTRPALLGLQYPLDRIGLLTIDAHFDLRSTAAGLTNGNPIRALIEDGLLGQNVTQIGIQSFANSDAAVAVVQELGSRFVPVDEIRQRGIEQVVTEALADMDSRVDAIYVDLDIDVLDRASSPATPGSRPGGLSSWEVQHAIKLCGINQKVRILDVVEVDPERDVAGVTVLSAASMVLAFASGVLTRQLQRWSAGPN